MEMDVEVQKSGDDEGCEAIRQIWMAAATYQGTTGLWVVFLSS
jgi:hypothetical protein